MDRQKGNSSQLAVFRRFEKLSTISRRLMNWFYTQQHQLIDLSVMEFFGVSKNEQAQEFWVTCQKEISAPGCLVIAKFTLDQEVEALKELVRIYKILGEIY